jgi:class 3 adenylate cyclase/tetratricopeptide (TPR) repeat protein
VPTCASCGRENPEGFRFCGSCGAALAEPEPTRETRKTVTIVFSDVTGSTELGERLDPETTRRVMGRYYDAMAVAIERHGGTVEKYIGDAVMAVFGIPTLHEDDALRAVRAAADMRDALAGLNAELERDFGLRIQARTGVNTGEVLAGPGAGTQSPLAVGDPVNVAARLEQAAPPDEILLGEVTHRIVRDAVRTEAVAPIDAKGKSEPLAAHRLLEVVAGAEAFARRLDAPMIGREGELSQLSQAYERAAQERTAYLFTVLGAAGIGKSRLVREFLERVGGDATLLTGRCLPYGEGITYWPLTELVRGVDSPAATELLERVTGETGSAAEEVAYATRKLFEQLARERPLVVVLDDLHWAEPTFLSLVESVADWARDAPILLVAVARPELLDARPTWAGGKLNATSILLEALSEAESERLIDALLADPRFTVEVRRRVVSAAEGNPLFVEQMLAMAGEDGTNGDLAVPPTIQALLAARLERLPAGERATLERAAVIGKEFSLADVREVSPAHERAAVGDRMLALARKELLRPAYPAEDVFRFRHLLIRDAAYHAMSKEARAELHGRYADNLDAHSGAQASELDEIVGYHLEQAYRYLSELGFPDAAGRALGGRAAERLATAGQRALARSDIPAAIGLLQRAIDLFEPGARRIGELTCDLSVALRNHGSAEEAGAALDRVLADGEADPALKARAELLRVYDESLKGSSLAAALARTGPLIRVLEQHGSENDLAEAYQLVGTLHTWQGNATSGYEAYELASELATRSGNTRVAAMSSWFNVAGVLWGPTPVEEGLRICERMLSQSTSRLTTGGVTVVSGAFLLLLDPAGEEAQRRIVEGGTILDELGQIIHRESGRMMAAAAYLLAGEAQAAEDELRAAHSALAPLGQQAFLSSISGMLALALCAQERYDEADPFAVESESLGAADDYTTQAVWRGARAQVLAARGDVDEAIALGRGGVAVTDATDLLTDRGLGLLALASALRIAGRRDEARKVFEQLVDVMSKKGAVAAVAHARRLVAEL